MKKLVIVISLFFCVGVASAETFNGITSTGIATGCSDYYSPSVGAIVCKSGDSGLALVRTDSGNLNDEGFLAMFAKDSSGQMWKTMSISSAWRNTSPTTGYSATRFNAVYSNNGVGVDDLSIVQFGGKGVTMLSGASATTDEPQLVGDGQTKLLIRGNTGVYQSVNGRSFGLTSVNTSTGASAHNRFRLGNSVSDNAFTVDVYGYYHATKPNYVEMMSQFNAPLIYGVLGVERMRLAPVSDGAALIVGGTDASGLVNGDLRVNGVVSIKDVATAPVTSIGFAEIFMQSGVLKVRLPNGDIKTIAFTN